MWLAIQSLVYTELHGSSHTHVWWSCVAHQALIHVQTSCVAHHTFICVHRVVWLTAHSPMCKELCGSPCTHHVHQSCVGPSCFPATRFYWFYLCTTFFIGSLLHNQRQLTMLKAARFVVHAVDSLSLVAVAALVTMVLPTCHCIHCYTRKAGSNFQPVTRALVSILSIYLDTTSTSRLSAPEISDFYKHNHPLRDKCCLCFNGVAHHSIGSNRAWIVSMLLWGWFAAPALCPALPGLHPVRQTALEVFMCTTFIPNQLCVLIWHGLLYCDYCSGAEGKRPEHEWCSRSFWCLKPGPKQQHYR